MPKDARKASAKRSMKSCEEDEDLVVEAILPSLKFNSNPASNKIGKFKTASNTEPVVQKVKSSTMVKGAKKAQPAKKATTAKKAKKIKKIKKAQKAHTTAANGGK